MMAGQASSVRRPAKRSRSERGDATLQEILRAAEALFADVGLSGGRLEGIAQAVGITRASVLHYFSSKQEIYDRVEAGIFEELDKALEERVDPGSSPLERLLQLIDTWLDFMVARPTAARIVQRNATDRTARLSDPLKYSSRTVACCEDVVREGQKRGDFVSINPLFVLDIVGGGLLHYVCNTDQMGESRAYAADDPEGLSQFRQALHAAAAAILVKKR